ncbi:MAG: Gfo/Idh/MocA family oxidoreductase [Propionibacteriaceae bacterium]|nr:Gfo/Idh/MocA family oxidoreductase [Propionibacteriaceae bacterium]
MSRIALLGQGTMATVHARAWRELGHQVVVFALEDTGVFARQMGATSATSLDEALASADIVDICTPTATHAELASQAIRAGLDVICEKPLALSAADCRELIDLAAEHGRQVLPAHVVRYFPQYFLAKEAVDAGRIGDLAVLRFSRTGAAPENDWFADEELSGGIILDQVIHDIDQAVWIAGGVESVYAVVNRRQDASGAAVQTAHIVLTHHSGAIAHCRGYWGLPSTSFWYGFDLAGTGGALRYDSRENTGFRLSVDRSGPPQAEPIVPEVGFFDDPYRAQLADCHRALAGESVPRSTAQSGCYAVAVAEAARSSAQSGAVVRLDPEGAMR